MNLLNKFAAEPELQMISECARSCEETTTGEIIVHLVTRSGKLPLSTLLASLILSLPFALCLLTVTQPDQLPPLSAAGLFIAFESGFLALFSRAVTTTPALPLLRCFLVADEVEMTVELAAKAAFFDHGLAHTEQADGVLLYISILEQKAWILADSGIDSRVKEGCWEEIINRLTPQLGGAKNGTAICEAIREIGAQLARHAPRVPGKEETNELRELIIET